MKDAIVTVDSSVVDDLEYEEYADQPRPTDEIVALIGELIDKVWYNRHKVAEEKVEVGEIELKPFTGKYDPKAIDPEIWKGALGSAKRVEEKYGIENVGPWDDFDWGVL